ncbi:putative Progesterone binding protein [Taphrina deformans PYCC 5710]|uniref:Progesterone binding protein n=1 Tax=Taphrina deformans (strain PYCC 5710 / ATCC 11124 / CBS 356.35 / IMI 108563 / JCM 9778 / NBRC 8474) TaxID=1097556 RepID=R4X749_TAPDE|nr:putative Progesterone binding protein [Taphrina deformans PYCC 5710]|eukprot:CCG81081.1 putative Progesterone binding protein [Taphrina deformans PYCC 5710]
MSTEQVTPQTSTTTTTTTTTTKKPRFAPKEPIQLDPPRTDAVSTTYLSKCTGKDGDYPTLVAIKGHIFDVSKNEVYAPGKGYNVFTGRDASCALGMTSLDEGDCHDDISGLSEAEVQTLDDWFTFFQYRYNIVGRVEGSRYFKE